MQRVRIQETINGRTYVIDVRPVTADRWRAEISGGHGRPTAVMPFYGTTPVEAAGRLTGWLARANRTSR